MSSPTRSTNVSVLLRSSSLIGSESLWYVIWYITISPLRKLRAGKSQVRRTDVSVKPVAVKFCGAPEGAVKKKKQRIFYNIVFFQMLNMLFMDKISLTSQATSHIWVNILYKISGLIFASKLATCKLKLESNDGQGEVSRAICSLVGSWVQFSTRTHFIFPDNSVFDNACTIKSDMSGHETQIQTRYCYTTTQHIPLPGLHTANSTVKNEWKQ